MGYVSDIQNIMRTASPANDDVRPDELSGNPPITIRSGNHSMIAVNGNNNRVVHAGLFILGLIILGVVLVRLIMYAFTIDSRGAARFSNAVAAVAQCESTTPRRIHTQMRQIYGYNNYSTMSIMTYHRAMNDLSDRLCD